MLGFGLLVAPVFILTFTPPILTVSLRRDVWWMYASSSMYTPCAHVRTFSLNSSRLVAWLYDGIDNAAGVTLVDGRVLNGNMPGNEFGT